AILRVADVDDPAEHTRAVLEAVALLAKRGAIPTGHRQRPPWLRPFWGRWRHAVAIQRVLSEFARSPTSADIAAATARARRGRALALPTGPLGSLLPKHEPSGTSRRSGKDAKGDADSQRSLVQEDQSDDPQWG